jgi:hypothetical protein
VVGGSTSLVASESPSLTQHYQPLAVNDCLIVVKSGNVTLLVGGEGGGAIFEHQFLLLAI